MELVPLRRRLGSTVLGLALALAVAPSHPLLARAPAAAGVGESGGRNRSSASGGSNGTLELVRTRRALAGSGDPIWELRLRLPGEPAQRYEAVVGRASRQRAPRHLLGSQAPLPRGHYRLLPSETVQPGDDPELGPLWIGLEPTFATDRRGLGIHHDPSAGRGAASGTDGCIGLLRAGDVEQLAALLARGGPVLLVVRD